MDVPQRQAARIFIVELRGFLLDWEGYFGFLQSFDLAAEAGFDHRSCVVQILALGDKPGQGGKGDSVSAVLVGLEERGTLGKTLSAPFSAIFYSAEGGTPRFPPPYTFFESAGAGLFRRQTFSSEPGCFLWTDFILGSTGPKGNSELLSQTQRKSEGHQEFKPGSCQGTARKPVSFLPIWKSSLCSMFTFGT